MPEPIIINAGEKVSFPVEPGHPLAQYQQLVSAEDFHNVHELAFVQTVKKANPTITTPQIIDAINKLAPDGFAPIFHLTAPDITIAAGGTMELHGPISYITAAKFKVTGELLVHGSLNLNCEQLGG